MSNPQSRDDLGIALLSVGIVIAVVATLLPVVQFRGGSGMMSLTTWQILPWFTKLKLVALALLMAAAFLPQLEKWRLSIAAVAILMVFIPAVSSFISAVYAWGSVRADIVRLSGQRSPFVHPGIGNAVLVFGALLVGAGVWRIEQVKARLAGAAAGQDRAAQTAGA
ncbi:MAG: hypothetical protein K2X11_17430 [Acetobacteraceae bacterium]|nr:hypothetical protein [Acetobacteraceae bacterium]